MLQSLVHEIINSPLGAVGLLLILFLVGRAFTKHVFDSPILLLLFLAGLFLLAKNIDALKRSVPIPGPHVDLLNAAISATQSEADYRSCLNGYLTAETDNSLLKSAGADCEAKRSAAYYTCMTAVKDDVAIIDKSAHCVAVAGRVWTPCVELALSTKATTYTAVQNCARGMTIDRARDAADANTVR